MSYAQKLENRINSIGNSICLGMDPVLSKIPLEGSPEEKVRTFYLSLLDSLDKYKVYPAAVKPNAAYFEAISVEAQKVLQELILECTQRGIIVVLDAKRGDIGKSSSAYAEAAFDVFKADCITASPYMGSDSLKPFLNYKSGQGVYGLLRTSNPGGKDVQDILLADGRPLYLAIADLFIEWNNGSLGAVVGATNPAELEKIMAYFVAQNAEIPFLIPGVSIPGVSGQQGGDAKTVINALKNGGSSHNFHLLNSSSGLNFAYEAKPHLSYGDACAEALLELIESCGA
jgi:orotidine-5'-phosphate decarboxylase